VKKARVLFLCTKNSARSQMAEAFLRKYGDDKFEALSAGLEPDEVHPYTKKVMAEIGIDISDQYSKPLKQFMGKIHIGYLITVCDKAEKLCPFFPGISVRLHWAFEDPVTSKGTEEEKIERFRKIRDQIEDKIKSWLTEFQSN